MLRAIQCDGYVHSTAKATAAAVAVEAAVVAVVVAVVLLLGFALPCRLCSLECPTGPFSQDYTYPLCKASAFFPVCSRSCVGRSALLPFPSFLPLPNPTLANLSKKKPSAIPVRSRYYTDAKPVSERVKATNSFAKRAHFLDSNREIHQRRKEYVEDCDGLTKRVGGDAGAYKETSRSILPASPCLEHVLTIATYCLGVQGSDLREKVQSSKILVVGAGGIGKLSLLLRRRRAAEEKCTGYPH